MLMLVVLVFCRRGGETPQAVRQQVTRTVAVLANFAGLLVVPKVSPRAALQLQKKSKAHFFGG